MQNGVKSASLLRSRRLTILLSLFVLVSVLYPISRRFLIHKPPAPAPSASVAERIRYLNACIAADPADTSAYTELGGLEEQSGYYTSALRRLTIARALGAPDAKTAGPLGRSLLRLARFEEAKTELEKAARVAPDSVEAVVNLAGWYNENARPEEAVKRLREFVATHPALTDPHLTARRDDVERLMLCCAEIGDGETALKLADQIIQIAPTEPNGYAVAGKELLAERRYPEAIERLHKALDLTPKLATLHFYLGVALASTGRHDAALEEWLKTITLDHDQTVAYYWLGGEYARRKQQQLAGVAYAQAAVLNGYDLRACRLAAQMFQRAGSKLDAAYWFSVSAGVSGDFKSELRYALQVLADPSPYARRIGLRGIADAYRGMQQPKEFLQAMLRLATRDAYNDYMMLAEAYADIDEFKKQEFYLRKALAKAPEHAGEVHSRLGATAKNMGRMDEAEYELTLAIQANPGNLGYHRDLGDLYFARRDMGDRLKRALNEYQQIVAKSPANSDDWQHLGVAYSASGDLRRAASCLEHAVDLQPGSGPCYQELGHVYLQMNDKASSQAMLALYRRYVSFTETQQTLTTRARAARKDPKAQVELADFLVHTGDYDNAAQRYALALQLSPKDAETRRKLARLYGMTGRKDLQFELEHPAPMRKLQDAQ